MNVRTLARTCAFGALLAVPLGAAPLEPVSRILPQEVEPYFARTTGSTTVYGWSDRNAKVVRELEPGALLKVHEVLELEAADLRFLEVSVAGGLEVWVFGEYLEETGREGVLRCTGNRVLMRPGPSSTPANLPIKTRLMRGDEVRFLKRNDPSLAAQQDWFQVRSPQDARGWVLDEGIERASDQAAAERDWKASATPPSQAAARPSATPREDSAELGTGGEPKAQQPSADGPSAQEALAQADALLAEAQSGQARFADVVAAYEAALARATPGSNLHTIAQSQLERARIGLELDAIEEDVEKQKQEHQAALRQASQEKEREELKDTIHWGRFNGRGWVRPRQVEGQKRYYLEWRGNIVREVTCTSGRYDLTVFENCEIGVRGDVLRNPTPASDEGPAQPQLLDLSRVEIISVRE